MENNCKTSSNPLCDGIERARVGVAESINKFYFLAIKLEFRDLAFMPRLLQISDVGSHPRLVGGAASNIKIIQ